MAEELKTVEELNDQNNGTVPASDERLIFADSERGGIIHVANIKGGVGKSTLATNLAASLSKKGNTLLIDLDAQGSASVALGVDLNDVIASSWALFKRRYTVKPPLSHYVETFDIKGAFGKLEEMALSGIRSSGSIDDTIIKVRPELHVSPAGAELFNSPSGHQLGNFISNLSILRERYKYIVIDTPSVWNRVTRTLYINSDLNLIPVTLDALSTNSLREYLVHVKKLVSGNPHVRLRIVKNEVASDNERPNGKTRTISTNRRFLESLCERVAMRNDSGVALLPQSIMFDLEIPEASSIRDAQDVGLSVYDYEGAADVTAAFDLLAKNVQYVLNGIYRQNISASALENRLVFLCKACAAALLFIIVSMNSPVPDGRAPRPIAPQQVVTQNEATTIKHTFGKGDNATRLAKHAISVFRAVVPTQRQVNEYLNETIETYNLTRDPDVPKITHADRIPLGTELTFYPPMNITNKNEKSMVPAYRFYMNMVNDPYPYVTGDWCERGTGGGQPHYAIDVAATYGAEIISPVDGKIVYKNDPLGGRCIGVVFDNSNAVIFFMHLEQRLVKEGAFVKKGTPIGTIGMTGRTSGPHAHIGYGIISQSRHDISFGKYNFRLSDPKHLFYQMAYMAETESEDVEE